MKHWSHQLLALASICLLATAVHAEKIDLPNMMEDAKVGDWILLEMQGGIQMKQMIEEVTPDHLTLKVETIMNGQVISTMSQQIPRTKGEYQAPPADTPKPVITKGKYTVKGKELDCWIVEMNVHGNKTRNYFSKDVPVNGLVKSEMDGQTTLKLIDFGRK